MDGREPASETRYFHDRRGRLVRSVTRHEPSFTEQDRAELLALTLYREGLCPLCKRPLDVCTSHEATGPEFTASYTMCRATAAMLEMQRRVTGDGKKPKPNAPAYLWGTTIKKG